MSECAFQSVVGRLKDSGEGVKAGLQHFQATWIECLKGGLSGHKVKRGTLSRTSFSQGKSAMKKTKLARVRDFDAFEVFSCQCSRPLIIRWMTSQRSSSMPMAMRLPTLRS